MNFNQPKLIWNDECMHAFVWLMKTMLSSRVESPIVLNHVKTKNNYIDHMIMFRF